MATEYDLIRRYKGAFSSDDCKKLVNYIDGFEKNKLLAHDTRALHEVDNKALNVTHSYDMTAYSFVAEQTMPKFKKCLDEYLNCLLYTSPSPRDRYGSRMPSSA